jgi:hypothetical protein
VVNWSKNVLMKEDYNCSDSCAELFRRLPDVKVKLSLNRP